MNLYTISINISKGRSTKRAYAQHKEKNGLTALHKALIECCHLENFNRSDLEEFVHENVYLLNFGVGKGNWIWATSETGGIGACLEGGIVVQTDQTEPYVQE